MKGDDSSPQQLADDATNAAQPPLNPQDSTEIEPGEKRKRSDLKSQVAENSDEPKVSVHPLWKTSMCSFFRRSNGVCSHGDKCRYAHGEEELRLRPDNTWDPTSERAKKLLKVENGDGVKAYGVSDPDEEGGILMTEAIAEDSSSEPALEKCLVNLPMKWSSDNLRSFLTEQGILFKSAKKKKGMIVGFASFETVDQVKAAVKLLDGKAIGPKNLKVTDVLPRSFDKKNKVNVNEELTDSSTGLADGDSVEDVAVDGSSILKGKSVRDAVTPLAHMSYTDQLERKKSSLVQTLKRLTRNARKACTHGVSLPEWIIKSREIGGLPCELEGIIESPLVNGYRNKCEFSIGYSLHGKPTVGFLLGNFREGVTAVEEPVDCPNVSRISCQYAAIFQEFLQHSGLLIWNRLNNTGFWRQLTVREGRNAGRNIKVEDTEASISEVMLMVQVSSAGFEDSVVKSEFDKMAQALIAGASASSPPLPLTALVVQDHNGISNVASADAPLRSLRIPNVGSDSEEEAGTDVGEARIHDYISNLSFCISPTAFFQVNTLAAEKLYSLAGDWANLGPDTLLFDICCGTGTIGLTLAYRVGMVVGIEMNAAAVSDAIRNAEINGIENCRFVCGKAEDVMGSLLKEYLNLPQGQVEVSDGSQRNDEMPINEEKVASKCNGLDAEEKVASVCNGPDTEENSESELKNNEEKSKDGVTTDKHEPENQPPKSCSSTYGNAMLKHYKEVVAIVDPPRVGLHPTVIKALRTQPRLRRLVYISCNPESLVANAIELCTPSRDKTVKGNSKNRGWRNMSSAGLARHRAKSMPNSKPFSPIKAMAVDLFRHTPHCELVMLLER